MWRVVVVLSVVSLAFWAGGQTAAATEWSPPVSGTSIALPFGAEYPGGVHRGIDLPADVGAAIQAPSAGRVAFAGTIPADGGGTCNAVTIETADGHKISLLPLESVQVQAGASVCAGDTVGRLAVSGDDSSASPHLHLGLRQGDRYTDPAPLLASGGGEPVAPPASDTAPEPFADPADHALPDGGGTVSDELPRVSASVPLPEPAVASASAPVSPEPMTAPRPASADFGVSPQASTAGSPSSARDTALAVPGAVRATRLLRDADVTVAAETDLDVMHGGPASGGTTWTSTRTSGVLSPVASPVFSALVALGTAAGAVMPIIARSKALARAR